MPLLRGDVLAGYTIDRLLGAGALGAVYVARDSSAGRVVALRVIDEAVAAREQARDEFLREAALLVGVDYPGIATVWGHSSAADEELWIAGQYVDGVVGTELLEHGALAPRRAVALVAAAAQGLDDAHAAGILHGDFRPGNLVVVQEGGEERVLVTDFGIAQALDDLGTASFAYTAPERFSKDHPVDQRADVYSLGSTLYEFLTGRTPFPRTDPDAVKVAHRFVEPVRPSMVRPELPSSFDQVIATALAKDPAQRYRSCQALADAAVEALTLAEFEVADTVPPPRPAAKVAAPALLGSPEPRSGSRTLLTVAAAVLLIGTVVAIAFEMDPGRDQTQAAGPSTSAVSTTTSPLTTQVVAPTIAPETEPPIDPALEPVIGPDGEPIAPSALPIAPPVLPVAPPALPVTTTPPVPETTTESTFAEQPAVTTEPSSEPTTEVPVTEPPLSQLPSAQPTVAQLPTTEPTFTEIPVTDNIAASARAQCSGYITLVQQNGADGALAIVENQPAAATQDPAITREAIRLAAAGECG